jgi:hypothetical protein
MIIGSSTSMYGHEEDGYKSTESENKIYESRREEIRGLDAKDVQNCEAGGCTEKSKAF